MDPRLLNVIEEYFSGIQVVLRLMQKSGIPRPKDLSEWMVTRNEMQIGSFCDGTRYFMHGYGIAVDLPLGVMDFDFGPNGEVDLIDIHWVIKYVAQRLNDFGFNSEGEIKQCFDKAIQDGEIVKFGTQNYRLPQ